MNEVHIKRNPRDVMFENVRYNAGVQLTAETRENYFKSCEAHGGELYEVVQVVRKEFSGA